MNYTELHCHSYYSFHDGASSLEELMVRAKELGYHSLAITDHDNLCGAMRFAHLAKSLELHGIIGTEITLRDGHHLTLLAKDRHGYANICRIITEAHASGERNKPELPPERFECRQPCLRYHPRGTGTPRSTRGPGAIGPP